MSFDAHGSVEGTQSEQPVIENGTIPASAPAEAPAAEPAAPAPSNSQSTLAKTAQTEGAAAAAAIAAGAVMMAGVETAAIPGCVIGSFKHEGAWIGRFTESRFETKTIFRFQNVTVFYDGTIRPGASRIATGCGLEASSRSSQKLARFRADCIPPRCLGSRRRGPTLGTCRRGCPILPD